MAVTSDATIAKAMTRASGTAESVCTAPSSGSIVNSSDPVHHAIARPSTAPAAESTRLSTRR
jgi:hypothetical protein